MNGILKLILLIMLLPATPALAGFDGYRNCMREFFQKLFPIVPSEGELIPTEQVSHLLPYTHTDYTVRRLGGHADNQVIRVHFKHLPQHTPMFKFETLEDAVHDQAGFEILKKVSVGQNETQVIETHILTGTHLSQSGKPLATVQLSNTQGRSLFSILADEKVPENIKVELKQKYNRYVKSIERKFRKKYMAQAYRAPPDSHFFPSQKAFLEKNSKALESQPYMYQWTLDVKRMAQPQNEPLIISRLQSTLAKSGQSWPEDRTIRVIIKSDNFIVDPEYDLFVIDPF